MKPKWIGGVRKVSKLSGYTKMFIGYGFILHTRATRQSRYVKFRDIL